MRMPKQTTKLPACYFFDEMQQRMQAEDNKRRKLSNKSVNAQPELLFLQFDPKRNKEALGASSNKCHSPPCDSYKHKKPWRPPRMVLTEPGTSSELDNRHQSSGTKQILEDGTEKINLLSVSFSAEDSLRLTKSNTIDCSPDIQDTLSNYLSLVNKHVVRTSQEDEKEHILTDKVITHEEKSPKVNVKNNDCFSNTNSDIAARDEQSRDNLLKIDQNCLIEHNSSSVTICGSDFDTGSSKITSSNENADIVVDCRLKDVTHKSISQESFSDDQISQKIEHQPSTNKKSGRQNRISECDRISDFEDLLTQTNPNLETSKVLKDEHDELKVDKDKKDYSEHEDILNSIEMILSEGQKDYQEQKYIKNVGQEQTEEPANQMLIDSVSDNNCISENADGELQDLNIDANFYNVGEKSIKECPLNLKVESSVSKTTETEINNFAKEEIKVLETEAFSENLLDKNDNNNFVKEIYSEMYPCKPEKKLNNEKDENEIGKAKEKDNNISDGDNIALDDEYSCLMISNSQLLEIEKKYYEAPQNLGLLNNVKPLVKEITSSINLLSGKEEYNKRNISVATQTDLSIGNLQVINQLQQPPQVLTVKWPKKIQETQRQLRETIQEINRLNAVLLKARQQIWPQRNMESGPGPSSRDNCGNNMWQNK